MCGTGTTFFTIVLSVLRRLTTSDYLFGIFKHFVKSTRGHKDPGAINIRENRRGYQKWKIQKNW
jgi:hypothetical protein